MTRRFRVWCFRALLAVALTMAVMDVLQIVSPSHSYPVSSSVGATLGYFFGQAGICTLRQAVSAPLTMRRQSQGVISVSNACREISKGPGDYTLWRTPKGEVWFPRSSSSALFEDIAEQQRNIYDIGGKGVARGDIVLDCGANVGLFTREALAKGALRVIAVEPAPENLECLRRNLANEIRTGKVILFPKGVWDKDDSLLLHRPWANSAADSFVREIRDGDSVRVLLTTIDRLVADLRLERVDFIKMDIEGAERQALSGAVDTLRRFNPRMSLAVYHLPDDSVEIPRRVRYAVPSYRTDCSCIASGLFAVAPQVMQFY